jgi:hypothetical protein
MLREIFGIVIIIGGTALGIEYFTSFVFPSAGMPLIKICALLLFGHQLIALFGNIRSEDGTMFSTMVPVLFMIVAVGAFFSPSFPEIISKNTALITAILMIVEGLYSLH